MRQTVLIGAISSLMTFSVRAAELGDLRVRSHLNEPLQLELGLKGIGASDTLAVKAGTLDLYRKAGRIQPPEVLGLRVEVIGTNPYRLRIVGKNNVAVSTFPLIVEVMHNGTAMTKSYTVLLNEAPVKKNATPVTKQAQGNKSVESKLKPGSRITVAKGQTLWALARKVHSVYPSASLDQVVVALVRTNRSCFKNGRIDSLRLGCSLRLPSGKQVRSVTQDRAMALVRIQSNADMTKEPSSVSLKKARERLAKTDPVWADRLKKERAQTQQSRAVGSAPLQTTPLKAANESKPQAKVTTIAVKPQDKTSTNVAPVKSETDEKQEVRPLPDAVPQAQTIELSSKSEGAKTAVIDSASAPKAASERKTLWAWLSVFFTVGTLLGVGFLLWRRQKKSAMKCDPREQPVRFMKRTEGMTKEQEQGVQTMLSNRLEADKAAERGFVVRRQEPSTQDRLPETQGGFVGSPHRDEGAAEKNEAQQSQGTLSEVAMTEPKLGDISHLRNALTRAMQDQLDSAKEFMQVGADQQALKVLQQVMQQGNSEQKREAAEMMREIEAGQSGTSLT